MPFDSLRPFASKFIDPIAKVAADTGISPNVVSAASLVFAAIAGLCFYYSLNEPLLVLAAGFFVFLNSYLDALDGAIARYLNAAGNKGDFLDHV
ncbi:MAG: CDP-alcohol phosphatidyltransferase family protein, partial [Methanosarcinaceae archaeon]|nr:CDP-alcohol phosphatidyltransferase family protein [Methanosarcinaceae archaeon]